MNIALIGYGKMGKVIDDGVLQFEGGLWSVLAGCRLWRRAGVVIGKNPRGLVPYSSLELGAVVAVTEYL